MSNVTNNDTTNNIVHAKWLFVHPLQKDDGGALMCSNCKTGDWDITLETQKCPYCGAVMDLNKESSIGE